MREPAAAKLFIGQIPKDWTDADLRSLFEPFGEIHSLHILQDKATPGQHRGCAFLTYFENEAAKAAQSDLHEKKTLPGMKNPMQVKPAASETSEENRKLFVGMISKSTDENDLREMFSEFGSIDSITVLKDNGASKGCAFIKFETRLQAQNAIKQMHHSKTMEGCRAPIVVKLADSEKDKLKKKNQGMGIAAAASTSAGPSVQQYANNTATLAAQVAYYQQMFAQMGLPQVIANAPGAAQSLGQTSQVASATAVAPSAYRLPLNSTMTTSLPLPYTTNQSAQQQKEGPDGANLFIYQVPIDFNDSDLMQTFSPFGNVLSAKIFIDKQTGFSKGFGFVSYDNASSANTAISAMNGFAIGSKRLKVQLKRKRDQGKPY